jgi:hypothetical protein
MAPGDAQPGPRPGRAKPIARERPNAEYHR